MTRLLPVLLLTGLFGCTESQLSLAPGTNAEAFEEEWSLRIDVYPAADLADGALLPESFDEVFVDPGYEVALPLSEPVTLYGSLTGYEVNPSAEVSVPGAEVPVQGVVRAFVPGTPMSHAVATDVDGSFRMQVVPHAGYSVAWVPSEPHELAFLVATDEMLLSDTDQSTYLDLGLPVFGDVTYGDGLALQSAAVQVVDPVTGIAGPAVPVNEDGSFTQRVYPGNYELHVFSTGNLYVPEQVVDIAVFEERGLYVPVRYPTIAPEQITGEVVDEGGAPVDDVQVRFTSVSIDGAPDAQVVVHSESASNGLFSVRLVPGTYQVEYLPPHDAEVGPALADALLEISASGSIPTQTLAPRPMAQGTLLNEDNLPVGGVRVRAQELEFGEAVYETTTNDEGLFVLPVSEGGLEWTFAPPVESGSATTFLTATAQEVLSMGQLHLSTGSVLEGRVTWGEQPAAWSVIEVRDTEDRLFGTTVTDQSGRFSLRIVTEEPG